MTSLIGDQGEMSGIHDLSDRELEQLLSGRTPEGAPGLEPLADLLAAGGTAFRVEIDEVTALRHVAAAAEAARLAHDEAASRQPVLQPSRLQRTRRRIATVLTTLFSSLAVKVAAASVALAAVAGAGAAATGHLPDELQTALSEAAAQVGIDIPRGDEDAETTQADGDTGGVWDQERASTETDDSDAEEIVDNIFDTGDPQLVDDANVEDSADADRTDEDNPVDDAESVTDDPTGNADSGSLRP